MTTQAASGHPTSSLSAVELLVGLLFGGAFRADLSDPAQPANDRLIFSKGHASPLFYALYAAAGAISDAELETYRQAGSPLEGHPRPPYPYAEVASGSLGQGLSVGCGMALAAKLDKLPYRTYVLLGDSEFAEGSNWEALQFAASHGLDNLVGILDVNRLGQRGETMFGHDLTAYETRIEACGWNVIRVEDGHDLAEIHDAYKAALTADAPTMIVARTIKGKGVALLEDKENWHGKTLPEKELSVALEQFPEEDLSLRGEITAPKSTVPRSYAHPRITLPKYARGDSVATRRAFGETLARLGVREDVVALDGEVGNSTHADLFAAEYPERYIESYIAEQQMVSTAVGMAKRGKRAVVATFAAFLSRAHDQLRMAQYSDVSLVVNGSHAGVSIGQDGPSQMGLEDLAMFRGLHGSLVVYPADATATARLTELAFDHEGISYIRTARPETEVLYGSDTHFMIGGSETLRESEADVATIFTAGVTVYEAIKAADILAAEGIAVRVVDLYSIKPIDSATIAKAVRETKVLLSVEDHGPVGGLADSIREVLPAGAPKLNSLAVRKVPGSATSSEQLHSQGIDHTGIMKALKGAL